MTYYLYITDFFICHKTMPTLTINDIDLFSNILKSLSFTTTISFKITDESFCIFSHDLAQYFVSLPNTFYTITNAIHFTVHTSQIVQHIDLFQNNLVIELNGSFHAKHILNDTVLSMEIPFITFVDIIYQELSAVTTKFLIKKNKMQIPFTGIVNYRNDADTLIVKREAEEANEEIIMHNIDFIECKNLNFTCSNTWFQILNVLQNEYEDVLFSFCEHVLSVQFIFKKFENSFFEIHIPRSLIL